MWEQTRLVIQSTPPHRVLVNRIVWIFHFVGWVGHIEQNIFLDFSLKQKGKMIWV